MTQFQFRLFVTGRTPKSDVAIGNIRRICDHVLAERYSLEIVDVLEDPALAEQERVMATPTLIKMAPPPVRRIIGDLSDTNRVLNGLDLKPMVDSARSSESE